VRDRNAVTTKTLGAFTFSPGTGLRFSADSRFLAYATTAANVASDTNNLSDVYLYDLLGGTSVLVSRSSSWSGAANGSSDSPDISPDGRYVAYRSTATDIVPGDTNGQTDLFLYDRLNGTTTLLSASLFGNGTANNASMTPVFWPNSQGLLFGSVASDLVAQDCNGSSDILSYRILSSGALLPFYVRCVSGDPANPGLWLAWPVVSGRTYRAQVKPSVGAGTWQTLSVSPEIIGNQGYFRVTPEDAAQNFYRIVGF
jgi:hypothetical protein